LVGRASPEGLVSYNQDLSQRRVQLVENVLISKGIERKRIVDVIPECTNIEAGVYACGEVGAAGPEERQVKLVFEVNTEANP
jgi:hypothetical protein